MSIAAFIRRFFAAVEATPCPGPSPEELVDGKAFKIKHYPLKAPIHAMSSDTINASIEEDGNVIAQVSEPIHKTMTIDTISMVRFNDALGYKHAVGALFRERKK